MQKYIASIDIGTTSTRCMIFDENAKIVASSHRKNRLIYPKPGWVEQDPYEILENVRTVISDAIKISKSERGSIIAIGITNQRETVVAWNKENGIPFYNAISWQDTRTKDICNDLEKEGYGDLIKNKTGLSLNTYFSAPKIKWLLENVEKFKDAVKKEQAYVGNVDSWIIYNLTGKAFATDYTNASRTMLMDIRKLDWDQELLNLFKIPDYILPEIFPSSNDTFFGFTSTESPFKENIPISGVMGDQQASLLGQACTEPGMVKNTYGTGSFILMNTGNQPLYSKHGMLTTVAFGKNNKDVTYALEGSIAYTGSTLEWLKNNLGILENVDESEVIAEKIKTSDGVYIVPAFSGLYAPYWDMDATGLIIGLTAFTKNEHIIYAALESTCYQTRDVIEAMEKDSGKKIMELRVDGGGSKNNYLMQLQANILGVNIIRSEIIETTSLGVALAAGMALDYFKGDLQKYYAVEKIFKPEMPSELREKNYRLWKKAVERSKKWKKI